MKISYQAVPSKELQNAIASELSTKTNEISIGSLLNEAQYGFCPECGTKGVQRERRIDGFTICEQGHKHTHDKFTSR